MIENIVDNIWEKTFLMKKLEVDNCRSIFFCYV